MTEIGKHAKTPPGPFSSEAAPGSRGALIIPPARIARRWNGALQARLNRAPLESFLRLHRSGAMDPGEDVPTAQFERVCLFIIEPVLPHRTNWLALCHLSYFRALGETLAGIGRGLGEVIKEPRFWRLGALRAMGILLTPTVGLDMAAAIAAASVGSSGFSRHGDSPAEGELEKLTIAAVMSKEAKDLIAVRAVIEKRLVQAAELGAARMMAAPQAVRIWAEPPSNR